MCQHTSHAEIPSRGVCVCRECGVIVEYLVTESSYDNPTCISKVAVSNDIKTLSTTLTSVNVSPEYISKVKALYIKYILLMSSHGIIIKARNRNALIVISIFECITISDALKSHFLNVFDVSGKHINAIYAKLRTCKN